MAVMPALYAAEKTYSGVEHLLRCAGERLIEPCIHAARYGIVDKMLELMHKCSVAACDVFACFAARRRILDSGISIDMDHRKAVIAEVARPKISGDIALAGLPSIVYVIE